MLNLSQAQICTKRTSLHVTSRHFSSCQLRSGFNGSVNKPCNSERLLWTGWRDALKLYFNPCTPPVFVDVRPLRMFVDVRQPTDWLIFRRLIRTDCWTVLHSRGCGRWALLFCMQHAVNATHLIHCNVSAKLQTVYWCIISYRRNVFHNLKRFKAENEHTLLNVLESLFWFLRSGFVIIITAPCCLWGVLQL